MISFDIREHRFQLRAAAICLRSSEVLLHRLEGDLIWALPGGRVEPGEDAATTVVREMEEETGEVVECQRLLYVVENFFIDKSKQFHEIGFYFLAQLPEASLLAIATQPYCGIERDRQLEFRWFPLSELSSTNLYPAFLRTALCDPQPIVQHVVQRD